MPRMTPPPLRRHRRLPASWGMLVWLSLVWVLLWGEVTVLIVVSGVAVALVVTWLLPLPTTDFDGSFRPWGVVRLVTRFLWDVLLASIEVAAMAIRRQLPFGAVIRVQLRSHSDVYLTITSALTALVPGSVVVEANRFTGTLYVHILDVDMHGGLAQARRNVLEQEEHVLRAFGSRAELLDAGLMPGPTPRAGFLYEHEPPASGDGPAGEQGS